MGSPALLRTLEVLDQGVQTNQPTNATSGATFKFAPPEPTQQSSSASIIAAVPEHLIDNHHSIPKAHKVFPPTWQSKRLLPQLRAKNSTTEDMQQEAIDVAQEAMGKFTIEKDIAQHIKKTLAETKHFIYFYLGHCAILLFKTQ
ncbi:hypothetical protein FHL15_005199 [Xylaria flabelliformis]|uniref:Uncharacterized protein n=1 Tax=Xylaria flabelliformis TaxID=2512241 RepID=A0A553I0T3_9PEZI|nr:hypothetical protein FHL15_005199 [Xylaria flabelliformis]